ncbi:enoyl-CoA hydratase/isomerase family protein [Salinicola endophyticus]|uniref:3-hydroxyisobutyryl-CoA hydrolase n=1 Tax=Salinicola endophyticus TaxID=1949083 RepID=A0ABY8FEI8_9GAMM|nr:enoyl-CoA hydratase/isomerase family protein [Salinicola endophyticus]WFF41234.1 enoyl-CoA hydratase/isomerase family protein [Salinicola endophyticus]
MSAPVQFDTLATADGHRLGRITLDAPKSLNALSLEMIDAIQAQIGVWAEDAEIVALWLEGAGDKAFCAGGDVVALYRAIAEGHTGRDPETADGAVARYFTHEYRLDHALHTYPKPIVAWGDGIVMGGGMGLLAGASHRVVTPRSMLAMPEITIGLYPDVGASWFLNRMPGASGTFLGLTGARLNASDALFVGLADRLIAAERRDAVIDDLLNANWSRPRPAIERVLRTHAEASRELAPPAEVAPRQQAIAALTDADSDEDLIAAIIAASDSDDAWIARAARSLAAGSPLSARLILRQLARCRRVSLAEALRSELDLSLACATHGDIAEGVRALLIDKDHAPAWRHTHDAVPAADLEACLAPAWPRQSHPLRELHDHVAD